MAYSVCGPYNIARIDLLLARDINSAIKLSILEHLQSRDCEPIRAQVIK